MMMPYRRRRYPSSLGLPLGGMVSQEMRKFDAASIMKTDISQTESGYEFTMELPGFSKEDVQAQLKDGYLIVSAQMGSETEDAKEAPKAEDGATAEQDASQTASDEPEQTWVRRERFFGNCQRSFYLGEDIDEEGVTAKFENGLLMVSVPKMVREPEPEQARLISIQG